MLPAPSTSQRESASLFCMTDAERLGESLRALRSARGWSQTQTAQTAGVAQTVVSRLERGEGKQPSAMVLQRLASAFGVEVRDLTGVANDSAPAPRVRVVREDPEVEALEEALFRAKSAGDYTVSDFDAARAVARETYRHMLDPTSVDSYASAVLRAAKLLRKEGKEVTTTAVLARMVFTSQRQADALDEASQRMNDEADAGLRAQGYEPGQGAASLQARLAKIAAKKRRDEGE